MDPISAIATATAAFNAVKRLVSAGRELEDVAGHLGKWFTAASDIFNAEQQAKKPPLFRRLIYSGSIEEEALNATVAKQRLMEQERELRSLIVLRYGESVYREMIQMRRSIREKREREVYRVQKRRRNIVEGIIIAVLLTILSAVLAWFIWLIDTYST